MKDHRSQARSEVFRYARKMREEGLVVASAGNISMRLEDGTFAVTPTSVPYEQMDVSQIAVVSKDGALLDGSHPPSGELPMHLAIYAARPDVGAVVHTHGPSVCVLSVLRRELPPVIDEMLLYFGGTVRVAEYAFTGTPELGANVIAALEGRGAALLANHGNVCIGRDLEEAMHRAIVMESTARTYLEAMRIGEIAPLPEDALAAGRRLFEAREAKR